LVYWRQLNLQAKLECSSSHFSSKR
jgi:hypothetical protein